MENSTHINTPLGWLQITDNGCAVTQIHFCEKPLSPNLPQTDLQNAVVQQISEYFAGKRQNFDFPFELNGTKFQQQVWQALQRVPYGETHSYGDIANEIGQPKATRAVGRACNKNPLLLVIPCHRIIGKNAKLTGFAAGIERKKSLLDLESNFCK